VYPRSNRYGATMAAELTRDSFAYLSIILSELVHAITVVSSTPIPYT